MLTEQFKKEVKEWADWFEGEIGRLYNLHDYRAEDMTDDEAALDSFYKDLKEVCIKYYNLD